MTAYIDISPDGSQDGRLTVPEARKFALGILAGCEAAEVRELWAGAAGTAPEGSDAIRDTMFAALGAIQQAAAELDATCAAGSECAGCPVLTQMVAQVAAVIPDGDVAGVLHWLLASNVTGLACGLLDAADGDALKAVTGDITARLHDAITGQGRQRLALAAIIRDKITLQAATLAAVAAA